jgi:hypothetical protein
MSDNYSQASMAQRLHGERAQRGHNVGTDEQVSPGERIRVDLAATMYKLGTGLAALGLPNQLPHLNGPRQP